VWAFVFVVIIAIAFVLPNLIPITVPVKEKIADCTNDVFVIEMKCKYSPPYAIVLGLPKLNTNGLDFGGDIKIYRSNRVVASILVNSTNVTPCNWLENGPGLAGYILSWPTMNASDQMSKALVPNQSYSFKVTFSKRPPEGSSLWLSSMKKTGW
jgi:hypothetical protein